MNENKPLTEQDKEEIAKEIGEWDKKFNSWYWKWHDFKDRIRYLPVIKQLGNGWYYLKCALWHKYNRIHIKTLPPTWADRMTLLPHAMFQILRDFVDKECSPGFVDWDSDEYHRNARAKMDEILNWWENVYLKFDACAGLDKSKEMTKEERNTPIKDKNGKVIAYEWNSNDYEDKFYAEANRKEREMEAELARRMKELVDLRDFLWT